MAILGTLLLETILAINKANNDKCSLYLLSNDTNKTELVSVAYHLMLNEQVPILNMVMSATNLFAFDHIAEWRYGEEDWFISF